VKESIPIHPRERPQAGVRGRRRLVRTFVAPRDRQDPEGQHEHEHAGESQQQKRRQDREGKHSVIRQNRSWYNSDVGSGSRR
jgi:hypothetical protein